MNKKGFTLIELLAIIVILAVIAFIGFPIVTNIINQSRISAAARTCDGVVDAVENLYSMSVLQNANFGGATVDFDSTKTPNPTVTPAIDGQTLASFDYSGTLPQDGTITIAQDGTINWEPLTVNTYLCKSTANNGIYECKQPNDWS